MPAILLMMGCGPDGDPGSEAPQRDDADAAGIGAPGFPQEGTGAQDGGRGERLLGQAPARWELSVRRIDPSVRVLEYIPPDSGETHPRERLTLQSFRRDTDARSPGTRPVEMLGRIAGQRREQCAEFEHFNTFKGEENGYPAAMALMICHGPGVDSESQEATRIAMIKAIEGNERSYVVTRERELEPWSTLAAASDEDGERRSDASALAEIVSALSLYLHDITLCDDGRPEAHPCAGDES